jgi:hypothetical protein
LIADHLRALERIDREIEIIDAQLMEVEILAPGGRYDRNQEHKLRSLVRHLTPNGDLPEPEVRERGRPPKPPERKRRRPSRAKKL